MPVGTRVPERLCLLDFSPSKNSNYARAAQDLSVYCLAGSSMENMSIKFVKINRVALFSRIMICISVQLRQLFI